MEALLPTLSVCIWTTLEVQEMAGLWTSEMENGAGRAQQQSHKLHTCNQPAPRAHKSGAQVQTLLVSGSWNTLTKRLLRYGGRGRVNSFTHICQRGKRFAPPDDATLENGCLWYVPGSHEQPVTWPVLRNLLVTGCS